MNDAAGPHDTDILVWSEQQASLLRRAAMGDFVNDPALDWWNLAEEIESVGRSQLSAVRSLLTQALLHLVKVEAWPESTAVPGWRSEIIRFQQEAAEAFSPSMRQHIDIDTLYWRAIARMPTEIGGRPPLPIPPACPITLDKLLDMP